MISSSSENVTKLNSINRRMFITGSLKFFIMIGRNNGLKNYYFSNKIKISNVKFIEDTIDNFQSFYKCNLNHW